MPIYGYRCKSCNHAFEVVQSVSDEPLKNCPECDGPVSKIFFPVGISFKGSGFYVTDYKSKKHRADEKAADSGGSGNGCSGGNENGSGCAGCASVGTVSSN